MLAHRCQELGATRLLPGHALPCVCVSAISAASEIAPLEEVLQGWSNRLEELGVGGGERDTKP